jgi:hypothetical protein
MRRWVLSCAGMLVVALTITVTLPSPAPGLWVPGLAGTLDLTSETGETYTYSTVLADHFSAEGAGTYIDIGVSRNPGRPGPEIDYWQLRFEAPAGKRLERGTYRAVRDPLRDGSLAGMDVWGHGWGCNLGGGTFTVEHILRSTDDRIVLFVANFEQRCEPSAPVLRGAIRVRAGRLGIGDLTL